MNNDFVMTTTTNADGLTVRVLAKSFAALTTHVNLKKLDKKN